MQDKRARTKSQSDGKSDGRKDTSTDSQSLAVIDKFGSKVVAGSIALRQEKELRIQELYLQEEKTMKV